MKDIENFKKRALNPEHPQLNGTAQNPDIYFQGREAGNKYYDAVPEIVEEMMKKVEGITGRKYNLFDYYGAKDAEKVIVIMGSGAEAAEETVDYLNAKGQKVGLIKVRLYRPFRADKLVAALPKTCKYISVMDRTKESGSLGEPLYLDVVAALAEQGVTGVKVLGGRYGLGSKEFNPSMINAIYENMGGENKNHFTVGINDDVTHSSLNVVEKIDASPKDAIRCKFYGLGSDGTVGSNKNSIKIIGNYTEKYAQAYFAYDSKKSGGLTVSHLRFGDTPIKSSYLIDTADFVACHNPSYVTKYDMVSDLKDGGTFLLNSIWKPEEMDAMLPAEMKRTIARKHIKFYTIDAIDIVTKIGLGNRISTTMQSAFFYLAGVMPYEEANKHMKEFVVKSFSKKGEAVVNMNFAAIDDAVSGLVEVKYPESWKDATTGAEVKPVTDDPYYKAFVEPMLAQKGDSLPVSEIEADGHVPTATTRFEKRGVAVNVPSWISENCIQCNQCAFVCPHAAIRPVLQPAEVLENAPETFVTKDATGFKGFKYRMQVSALDCTGCGSCANVCPAKVKALTMIPLEDALKNGEDKNWDYSVDLPDTPADFNVNTVKGSQFKQPLFEFSGACAGCGETPYIKVITQLFGDRMVIANATGCSSIYGGSAPTCPYTTNKDGHGPAWANSLFEDNAEHGLGIYLGQKTIRERVIGYVKELREQVSDDEKKAVIDTFLATKDNGAENTAAADALIKMLESCDCKNELKDKILAEKDYLAKKSVWIFGGDGWAYDIGFGGVDHVLAQNKNVNVFVFDTEVYSNTGGQASKSSNIGQVAQFAAAGKETKKKSLAEIAMSYGYVYVAQVAMGANPAQTLKAIQEAEAYHGPSLIIGYAPCEMHSIKGGMTNCQAEMKKAVECGYWNLFRFNPAAETDKFIVDSKEPKEEGYRAFLMNEARYSRLTREFPDRAETLFKRNEEVAMDRYQHLLKLKAMYDEK